MTRPPCRAHAESRSALVDGALGTEQRDRLLVHLVHCAACRDDVAELRRVRDTVRTPPLAPAPGDLDARLIAIAGTQARQPLWTRPFRRTPAGALSSPRRALRRRATAVAVAAGVAVAGAGLVGYVAAPVADLPEIGDPTTQAQAAFGSTLAQLPVVNDAVGAVLAAPPAGLAETWPGADGGWPTAGIRALGAAEAAAALERAVDASDAVAYRGYQTLSIRSDQQTYSATVAVRAVPGRGSQAQVLDRRGAEVSRGFSPATFAARGVDDGLLALLESNFVLTGWAGAEAAGRPASMIEARRLGEPSLAARWWLDEASGIVLAQQTFDTAGRPLMAVAFTSLQISPSLTVLDAQPARPTVPVTDTVLTLAAAPALARQGWVCQRRLVGLSLVGLRSDGGRDPGALQLVYSDGLVALSVFEQRGRMTGRPDGASWDAGLGAWRRAGASSLASWQSGDTVFTVVTDGPADLLAGAVAALPHENPSERTTMGRIREGWATLLADMKG